MLRSHQHIRNTAIILLVTLILAGCGNNQQSIPGFAERFIRLRAWLSNPGGHTLWTIRAGERCGDAPMILPTNGYIGFGWDDSFRPGHRHSGYDIFGPDSADGVTPVLAASDGYLTREAGWKSAVIIRHPDVSVNGKSEPIWTFYTHMASADGGTSYIEEAFPPGTREVFVPTGTLLGYQGNWSGTPNAPTGRHLHFSVVKSTESGGYANETEIGNTYDPGPLLGLERNERGILQCVDASAAGD